MIFKLAKLMFLVLCDLFPRNQGELNVTIVHSDTDKSGYPVSKFTLKAWSE